MAIKSRRIGEQVDSNTLGRIRVLNNSALDIKAGDILSVTGTSASNGHMTVGIADANAGGAALILATGMKLVASHDIAKTRTGIAVSWKIVTKVDTTAFPGGAAVADGQPLFLSDVGTAGNTLDSAASGGVYQKMVGQVVTLSSGAGKEDGVVLVSPTKWVV
jgi:uncharacterized phosphosugar-binding protein